MTLRIVGADSAMPSVHSVTLTGDFQSRLANCIKRISERVNTFGADTHSAGSNIFSTLEEIQGELTGLQKKQQDIALLRQNLEDLYLLITNGYRATFEREFSFLPAKLMELLTEDGVVPLFDKLPESIATFVPSSARELKDKLEGARNEEERLKQIISVKKRSIAFYLMERENRAANAGSPEDIRRLCAQFGGE